MSLNIDKEVQNCFRENTVFINKPISIKLKSENKDAELITIKNKDTIRPPTQHKKNKKIKSFSETSNENLQVNSLLIIIY